MRASTLDIDLENLHLCPKECLGAVFWELTRPDPDVDAAFCKEEWFSSTLLEWGRCGKLLVHDDETVAFGQYAPATLFARLEEFPQARVSADAAYLAYVYVEERHRRRGAGRALVREVARDLVDRGYRAVEAVGDRDWDGGWVLPTAFLLRCGFEVIREHPRFPLLRLDLRHSPSSRRRQPQAAAVPMPAFGRA